MSIDFAVLKKVVSSFLLTRAAIIFVTFLGISTLPHFENSDLYNAYPKLDYWLRWANWDGGHYRGIAENGYLALQTVFFPLYPMLIKGLMFLKIPSLWGGLIISYLCAIAALYFLYQLTKKEFNKNVAWQATLALLIFPTSFYLNAVYTEALFLCLTIGAFYFAKKQNFFLAFLLAGFSAGTRLVGIGVIVSILGIYLLENVSLLNFSLLFRTLLRRISIWLFLGFILLNILSGIVLGFQLWVIGGTLDTVKVFVFNGFLILLGLTILEFILTHIRFKKILSGEMLYFFMAFIPFLCYLFFLKNTFGDPFQFVQKYSLWQKQPTLPWDGPINYFNHLWARNFFAIGDSASLTDFLFFVVAFVGYIFSFYKLPFYYVIYYTFALLIPLSSGTLLSFPRYALVIFPLFMLFGLIKNETVVKYGAIISLLVLSFYSILFINSFWVT